MVDTGPAAMDDLALPAPLRIRLFGPLSVEVRGRPLGRLRSRTVQWLLALLVLREGREVERSWLAGLLWPESVDAHGLPTLRRTLTDLRAALGEEAYRLESPTLRTLRIDLRGADADVIRFDATVGSHDPAELEQAAGIYRGPLLEGCSEEWVLPERQSREAAYIQALETLASLALQRQEPATAVHWLQKAVAADPYRETAYRLLMRALSEAGNYAAALVTYRDLRLRLHTEANAAPDPETEALLRTIRAEARRRASLPRRIPAPTSLPPALDPGTVEELADAPIFPGQVASAAEFSAPHGSEGLSPEPPPVGLPQALTSFVGRERELEEVRELLATARLVTLTGPGGVGKTRLALRVAGDVGGDLAGAIGFTDLSPLRNAELVPLAAASALGLREEAGVSLTGALRDHLRGRPALLVLDNCEHLIAAAADLSFRLLRDCPDLRILATSQRPLGIPGEMAWPVPSLCVLEAHGQAPLRELESCSAARLFVERGRAVAPEFRLTAENAGAVEQICRRLDGIPLAIELAAARLKILTPEQIARRLDDRFGLLTGGSRAAVPRQQTLRAALDWSYHLLSEPEQRLFRCLSVFTGSFSLDAVEAIWSEGEALDLLARLVDRSLVQVERRGREAGYRLLETSRQYARDLAGDDLAALRERHARYYLAVAAEGAEAMLGPTQGEWLDLLEAAHDNLRAALTWCVRPQAPPEEQSCALRLATAMCPFWLTRGHVTEGRRILESALAGATEPTEVRAAALAGAADLALFYGDYPAVRALAQESLEICGRIEDERGIARALESLGSAACHTGDYGGAIELHEQALAMRRRLGNQEETAESLRLLAWSLYSWGEYERARSLYQECLTVHRATGNDVAAARVLTLVGLTLHHLETPTAARRCYEEVIAISRRLSLPSQRISALVNLGISYMGEGRADEAERHYGEALELSLEVGSRRALVLCIQGIAETAAWRGATPATGLRAGRLLGAAEAMRESMGLAMPPIAREAFAAFIALYRGMAGDREFDAAWAEGRQMPLDAALRFALEPIRSEQGSERRRGSLLGGEPT